MDDGVNTPEYVGRVKGCFFLLLCPSGPCFGLTQHNMSTQSITIMNNPTIIMATINSGLSATGVSVVVTSVTLSVGIGVVMVETGMDVVVVVGWSDDVVVVSTVSRYLYN